MFRLKQKGRKKINVQLCILYEKPRFFSASVLYFAKENNTGAQNEL